MWFVSKKTWCNDAACQCHHDLALKHLLRDVWIHADLTQPIVANKGNDPTFYFPERSKDTLTANDAAFIG